MSLPAMDDRATAPVAATGRDLVAPRPRGLAYPDVSAHQFESQAASPFLVYLGVFLKHWRLVAAISAAAVLLGLIVTFLMPRIYTATTTIQIDREAAKVIRSQDASVENPLDPQFYTTQYELLKSRALAERAVDSLSLAGLPGFAEGEPSALSWWVDRIFSKEDADADISRRRRLAVNAVMKGLSIQPVPLSRIVKVNFSHRDAALAQRISASTAENFVAMTLDRRFAASSYARDFLDEKIQQVKLKLEESEKQVVAYARQQGIVNVDEKISVAGANLKALNESLAEATAERIKTEQLWAQAQVTNGAGLPQVMNDKLIEKAREKRAQLTADYQDKLRLMKPDFPEMRQIQAQMVEYDRQIARQIDLVKRSIRTQFETARDQEASFAAKTESLKAEVLDLRNRSIQYNILQREVDTNRSLYDGLLQQYKEVGVTGAVTTNNVSIIDKAEKPLTPSSPRLILNIPIALFLGLLSALATIAVLEMLDDTFKSAEEVESMLGLTALGVVPRMKEGKGATERIDVAAEVVSDPLSPIAEAYRSLRTALQFSTPAGAPKVLLVTSSQPGEGKSTTSLCLAANFAQLGLQVLLIDADLRKASLHKTLGVDNNRGLSNVLAGGVDASLVAHENVIDGVTLLASGPLPPNPAELLAGPQFASLLTTASEKFDVVIIDGPPIMGLADAPVIGSLVDGALLVIDSGETRRRMVAAAVKRMALARTYMVGVLLNKFEQSKAGHGYGYGYGGLKYFHYGAEDENEKKKPAQSLLGR